MIANQKHDRDGNLRLFGVLPGSEIFSPSEFFAANYEGNTLTLVVS
jgi:hypothetical protein